MLSVISEENHRRWFRSVWTDVPGAAQRYHPAPYPEELAMRLIRMFSFVGDVVLDPFMGIGTTSLAAAQWGRHSIGVEIEPTYFATAIRRIQHATTSLFSRAEVIVHAQQGQST